MASMANNSVDASKIVDGSVGTVDLANLSVTDGKINDVAVGKITSAAGQYFTYAPNGTACADGEILAWDNANARWACAANSSASAIVALTGDVTASGPGSAAATIANNAITSAKIADGTVTGTDLASATVALANMANNSVDASKIVDGSITGADIAASTVADSNIIGMAVDKITSGSGKYLTYMPNNVACGDQQMLAWDNASGHWLCTANPAVTAITSLTLS